ncbi:MAG: replication-associated recombination protein A [Thermosulfidibacteraceae bacterium]|jgi:putative ATPase
MNEPLYRKIRPSDIEEVVGQEHLVGKGGVLRSLLESEKISSMLFYGPPGVGKTLVAEIIAKKITANFIRISAVTTGIKELKEIAEEAKRIKTRGKNTIVFIDEIHKYNKLQQDFLLPFIEDGTIIVIGASTENPIFAINKALLSRMIVLKFEPLTVEHIKKIIRRAIDKLNIDKKIDDSLIKAIAINSNGDARRALVILELILNSLKDKELITLKEAEGILNSLGVNLRYDEDDRYNIISAFIKSVRGSDPDAALYWLSAMLEMGEDPLYITRRLIILAAEDIGLANPQALSIAVSAHHAVSHVGMPEGALILAMATIYLAVSPKSNSAYVAINKASEIIKKEGVKEVPLHLRDSCDWEKIKEKAKYLYPHDYPDCFVKQSYMPGNYKFYHPKEIGKEKNIKRILKELWGERYS